MDHEEVLRQLSLGTFEPTRQGGVAGTPLTNVLGSKACALVGLAALVSVGGAQSSFSAQVDGAIGTGATEPEIIDVLVEAIPIVGMPRVVSSARKVAVALGRPVDGEFDEVD